MIKNNRLFITVTTSLLALFVVSMSSEKPAFPRKHESLHVNDTGKARLKEAPFEILSPGFEMYKTAYPSGLFSGRKNSITRAAGEINGLTGIKLPDMKEPGSYRPLKVRFREPVKLLL